MARLRFVIPQLPPQTPPGLLFLTGEHRNWSSDPTGWTFQRSGEGAVLEAELPEDNLLNVKVRIQGQAGEITEEGDAWGGRAPAHRAAFQGGGEIPLPLAGWQDERAGRDRPAQALPPREEWTLQAPWGQQTIRLWWPSGAGASLPLLVMHDGQNVFDEAPTFAGQSWDVGAAAQHLADEGRPCLIAALPVGEDRSHRYVPFGFELNDFAPTADLYLDWIADTLIPALAARFGEVAPKQRALAGSSFGGLVTLYGGLRTPELFGTLGVFSPALWPADFALLRWMEKRAAPAVRVWLDMGDHEANTLKGAAEVVALTHRVAEQHLRGKVAEVRLMVGAGHWHDEAAWAARFPDFLRWWLSGQD
ncbi:alpha/beta hydrolase [Deinococcus oregonensis]|uniref:Alpha/beta hydrolase n=1 Tax=Deinococcus oregonensis TaxID=1805970 RepID=A0ABV6BAI2_9DEIO